MDHSDDEADPAVRKANDALRKAREALGKGHDESPQPSTASGLVPWAATAEARRTPAAAAKRRRVLGALVSVGLGVAGLGVGAAAVNLARSQAWLAPILGVPTPARDSLPAARARNSESLEQQMTEALGALQLEVAELRAALARARGDDGAATVTKRLDELAARLDRSQAETSGSIAELAAKIDPLRQDVAAKLQSVAERLDRLEHRREAATPAKPSEPAAEARAATGPVEATKKPPVLRSWVVRDVYDGIALVEGADGPVEVAPGEVLPGAGRVRSIERAGRGWVVVTSRGVIDSARGRF